MISQISRGREAG